MVALREDDKCRFAIKNLFANLVPHAKNHHDWYVKTLPDYPKKRKVIFSVYFLGGLLLQTVQILKALNCLNRKTLLNVLNQMQM